MSKREKKVHDLSTRAGWWVVVVAILTLEATSVIQFFYAQKGQGGDSCAAS